MERNINQQEAEAYCKSIGAFHVNTSAKTGMGVRECFQGLTHSKGAFLMARNL
jgi:hypothetical protein